MSIAIVFNNKDTQPWAEGLQAVLPKATIEVYPNISQASAVTFALCWKPSVGVLEQFPQLQAVQSAGAAVEHITRTQTLPTQVQLARIVDPKLTNDMWEFLLAGTMAHLRGFTHYQHQQANKLWQQQPYATIEQTTIAVLGLGKIGAQVAQNFGQLGFKVKGWANSAKQLPAVECYHGNDGLNQCLHEASVLINLLPLTEATEGILNKINLQNAASGAYLINVGRGEHLVETDLLDLLQQGQLSGALLDVFRQEPLPPEHPFWAHPQIRLTPHVASLTSQASAVAQIAQNYRLHLAGQPLQHTVSLAKGY